MKKLMKMKVRNFDVNQMRFLLFKQQFTIAITVWGLLQKVSRLIRAETRVGVYLRCVQVVSYFVRLLSSHESIPALVLRLRNARNIIVSCKTVASSAFTPQLSLTTKSFTPVFSIFFLCIFSSRFFTIANFITFCNLSSLTFSKYNNLKIFL